MEMIVFKNNILFLFGYLGKKTKKGKISNKGQQNPLSSEEQPNSSLSNVTDNQ